MRALKGPLVCLGYGSFRRVEGAGVVACLSNDLRGVQMEIGGDDEAPEGARRVPGRGWT